MTEIKLSGEEQLQVAQVVADKYAIGAFGGMVTNLVSAKFSPDQVTDDVIDAYIQLAARVKLRLLKLAGSQ